MITKLENTATMVLNSTSVDTSEKTNSKIMYHFIKRSFDIILSLIGLIFLVPVIILVKISFILAGDYRTIFYTQKRIGKNGREFKLYKFQSMISNADEILKQILEENEELREEYNRTKKLTNDPRITKIGKVLRNTSIDELPQLLNILKGDMSFIGNRPYLPREKEDMKNYYKEIIKTKPGLTGFWQVSLRSRGTFEQRLKMEEYYSNHYNLKLDIGILLKTVDVVLRKEGAK